MQIDPKAPTPLEYFALLVQSDEQFPLLEAAVSIAQDEYPDLAVQQVLDEVDRLLGRLKRRVATGASELERLRALNKFFFRDLGFAGNLNDYYDAGNSYLNAVLRTRRGIPISLALLWMELAEGLGLRVRGLGFPGHFMVRVDLQRGQVVIDPFTGESLGREQLSERLEPWLRHAGRPADDSALSGALQLQAMPPREIIARMLRNLKEIHRTQQDWQRLVAVQDRLIVLLPQAWSEYRDRGIALAAQGSVRPAMRDLECYLAHAEQAPDTSAVADRISQLRRAIN